MSNQPKTTADLKRKAAELRQRIIDRASAAPESLAIPEVRDFKSRQSTLQQEITAAQERAAKLVQSKAEYEPLEQVVKHAQERAAKTAFELEHLHRTLGKAAFDALLAGQISEQQVFTERRKLNAAIAELRKEHDSLTPPPDAGILDKTKAKAKQLAIAGKIKLEELKINGLDSQVGKQLVDSGQEGSIRCSGTEPILGQIATARANIAQAQQQREQAAAALESKKAGLRTAFGLAQIEGARSLDTEIAQCRQSVAKKEKELSTLRSDLSGKLLAASDLPEGEPLVQVVNELRQVELKVMAMPSTPLSEQWWFIAVMFLFCFPIGLFFVLKHPRWTQSVGQKEKQPSSPKSEVPGKLLSATGLSEREPLVQVANELRQVELKLKAAPATAAIGLREQLAQLTKRPFGAKQWIALGVGAWMALSVLCCGGLTLVSSCAFVVEKQRVSKELADADVLWRSGSKAEAVVKYKALIREGAGLEADQRSVVYSRAIDREAEEGDVTAAKTMLAKAVDGNVSLRLSSTKANELLAIVREEREAERKRKEAELAEAERKKAEETERKRQEAELAKADEERAKQEERKRKKEELAEAERKKAEGKSTDEVRKVFDRLKTEKEVQAVFGSGQQTDWSLPKNDQRREYFAKRLAEKLGLNPYDEDGLRILKRANFKEVCYDNGRNSVFVLYGGNEDDPYILSMDTKEEKDGRETHRRFKENMSTKEREDYERAVKSMERFMDENRPGGR